MSACRSGLFQASVMLCSSYASDGTRTSVGGAGRSGAAPAGAGANSVASSSTVATGTKRRRRVMGTSWGGGQALSWYTLPSADASVNPGSGSLGPDRVAADEIVVDAPPGGGERLPGGRHQQVHRLGAHGRPLPRRLSRRISVSARSAVL